MKFARFAAIVAGAGVAQVIAVPLSGITNNAENARSVLRFGLAVPPSAKRDGINRIAGPMKVPCGSRRVNRLRQKAAELSNLFRQALGLPLIQAGDHPGHDDGKVRFMPHIDTHFPSDSKVKWVKWYSVESDDSSNLPPPRLHYVHHPHNGLPENQVDQVERLRRVHEHHSRLMRQGSFVRRLHHALMHLGRWEGRAVAFVLGCGIGALLRMIWVFGIVMYRIVKGRRGTHEYTQITIIEEIADSPKSTPPTYTPPTYTYFVDEKVATAVEAVEAVKAPSTTEESK